MSSAACSGRPICWRREPTSRPGASTRRPFKAAEDRAVDGAVASQESAGLDVVTDGEMRRLSFQSQLAEAVSGFGEWDVLEVNTGVAHRQ